MASVPFVTGWEYRGGPRGLPSTPVTVPHDAMVAERRSPEAPSWAHGAYFPGGRYRYRKHWTPGPEVDGAVVALRFEGVYRRSRVFLDGRDLGGCVNGYREFEVRLDPYVRVGATHTIEVDVDNAETPGSRWYTGSGIYRPVWLEVRDPVHVRSGGVSLDVSLVGGAAKVRVGVALENPDGEEIRVRAALTGDDGSTARASTMVCGTEAELCLDVEDPALWSADQPHLHDLEISLHGEDALRDRTLHRVGLRVVELDPARGLLVNGQVVTLRGANVHHDHGVLGAVSFPAAERRRVQILKASGFNAIRSAHTPATRGLLEACDELGMYVLDEVFDGWYDHKTEADEAASFDEEWRADVGSMVGKDRLSPSVIMYSIGNENGEAFSPRGRRTAAAMVEEVKRLDPTRATTIGVNLVAAAFAGIANSHDRDRGELAAKAAPDMTSTAINAVSNRFGMLMERLPRTRSADRSTRELFELVDVAGYNYGTGRYRLDADLHPTRVMVGTESMSGDLARNWALVEELPSLIGDFVWAGWDYLGEAGGGSWAYGTRRSPFLKPYPQLVSGMGIIDITGVPGAALLLARAAWGLLEGPGIAVRPLDVPAGRCARTAWRSTDAIESWSWSGHEGERVEIEVYSRDEEVEVLIAGRSLGRRPAGVEHGFLARFTDRYERGTLEAIGYRDGRAVSHSALRSAGEVRLRARVDGELTADPLDLVYVDLELADDDGIVDCAASDLLTLEVSGPAVVAGFGSAAPSTEESFADLTHTTYRGRAQVVLRSTGEAGEVTLVATSRDHGAAVHTQLVHSHPAHREALAR